MMSDDDSHRGRLDRSRFRGAHNDSVYVQTMFAQADAIPEFYVFVNGCGSMRLGEQRFPVESGMAVNIPPNVVHEVENSSTAVEPLMWVSIGLNEA